MEPQSNSSPEFLSPQPISPELQPETFQGESPEVAPAAPEREQQAGNAVNQNQAAISLPQVQPIPVQESVQQPAQPIEADTSMQGVPVNAQDSDAIEKEWVDKAKNIAKNTRDDPRKQNTQVSNLRADYLHKRFGTKIRVPGKGV